MYFDYQVCRINRSYEVSTRCSLRFSSLDYPTCYQVRAEFTFGLQARMCKSDGGTALLVAICAYKKVKTDETDQKNLRSEVRLPRQSSHALCSSSAIVGPRKLQ
jgi:hypothetical protein